MPRSQPTGAQFQERPDALVDSQAEHFDRQDVIEPVDDQAGESVPLGVDDAIGIGLLIQP